jgi:hypothetical protein
MKRGEHKIKILISNKEIKMYRLSITGVVRLSDELFISNVPENESPLYEEFLNWISKDGNFLQPMNLSDHKILKKTSLREICQKEILNAYPIWKQIDINELQNHTAEDKSTMWSIINEKRTHCNNLELAIEIATTDPEIDSINW